MIKVLKSRLFAFILGAIIFSGITSVTAYSLFANQIEYRPFWKKSDGGDITNVSEAIDELYKNSLKPSKLRYIIFEMTKTKSTPAQGSIQLAEIAFYDKNQMAYTFPSSASIIATLPENDNEGPTKLIDNSADTKYCTDDWGATDNGYILIKIDLGENQYLDISEYNRYGFYTANDAESRDPSSWRLYGSFDGTKYYLLDEKSNYMLPSTRNTQSELWQIFN